jgi:hypothetical protein
MLTIRRMRIAGSFLAVMVVLCGCGRRSPVPPEAAPAVGYVENFRDSHGRLPSDTEFREWAAKTHPTGRFEYYSQKPASISGWGKPGWDFIAGGWDGLCFQYYQSWDKKRFDGAIR